MRLLDIVPLLPIQTPLISRRIEAGSFPNLALQREESLWERSD